MGEVNFKFEIVKHIGALSDGIINTELNIVKWNGRDPQYDLRRWKNREDGKVPYKGITLDVDELKALREILNNMEL